MIQRVRSFLDLFRVFGSVIPRCILWGVLGAVEGAVCDWSNHPLFSAADGAGNKLWQHPYSVHVFGMVLSFALVMRMQIAYARFWGGATQLR